MKAEEYLKGKNLPCVRIGDARQDTAWFYPYDTLIKMMEEYAQSQLKEAERKLKNIQSANFHNEIKKFM